MTEAQRISEEIEQMKETIANLRKMVDYLLEQCNRRPPPPPSDDWVMS